MIEEAGDQFAEIAEISIIESEIDDFVSSIDTGKETAGNSSLDVKSELSLFRTSGHKGKYLTLLFENLLKNQAIHC